MFTKDYKKKLIAPTVLASALLLGASPTFAYTVQKGDTLGEIAKNHGLTLSEIAEMNPQIKNLDLIYVGDYINTDKNVNDNVNDNVNSTINYTAYEKDLLARLVEAEAGAEPYAGKVAVAYVVLNRVEHADFPNTIKDVIYQNRQFTPVSNGTINNTPSSDSIRAVEEALVADRSKGAGSLFFYNPKTATSSWLDSKQTTIVIGNHVFKK